MVCVCVSLPFHKSLFLFVIFQLIRQVRSHANQLIKYNKSSKIYWQIYKKEIWLNCIESIVAREWHGRGETRCRRWNDSRMFSLENQNSFLIISMTKQEIDTITNSEWIQMKFNMTKEKNCQHDYFQAHLDHECVYFAFFFSENCFHFDCASINSDFMF